MKNDGFTLQIEGIQNLSYKLYEDVENLVGSKKSDE